MKGPAKGLWYHSTKGFLIQNQGRILKVNKDGTYEVELYSFFDGQPNGTMVVRADYFKHALFYKTDKEMREAYDNNYSPFAERKKP